MGRAGCRSPKFATPPSTCRNSWPAWTSARAGLGIVSLPTSTLLSRAKWISVREADKLASALNGNSKDHIPALASVRIRIRPFDQMFANQGHKANDPGRDVRPSRCSAPLRCESPENSIFLWKRMNDGHGMLGSISNPKSRSSADDPQRLLPLKPVSDTAHFEESGKRACATARNSTPSCDSEMTHGPNYCHSECTKRHWSRLAGNQRPGLDNS